MSRWFRYAAAVITVGACGFFLWHLYTSAGQVGDMLEGISMASLLPAFIASSLLFVLIYPLTGSVFPSLLPGTTALPLAQSIGVLATSQLARYLPGNVGQHIARGGMLRARGVPMVAVVPALMIEALLSVMAACAVATVALILFPVHGKALPGWPTLVAFLALGAAGLLLLRFLPSMARRLGPRVAGAVEGLRVHPWVALRCVCVYALNYVVVGLGLYLIAYVIAPGAGPAGLFIGAFSLSWIVGFLAPGLPAGLGVREGVLVAILEPVIGATGAVTVAALHRLSTTAGDAIAAALGAAILWGTRKKAQG